MATVGKIYSDIQLQLTGGKPSDDQNIWKKQILFVFTYVSIYLIEQKRKEQERNSENYEYQVDPILFKRFSEIELIDDKIDLPLTPLSYPEDMGVVRVFAGSGDCMNTIPEFNFQQSMNENSLWFQQIHFVREGNKIILRKNRNYKKVTVVIAGIPDDMKDTDLFPIPQDLIAMAMEMSVKILRNQLSIPVDNTNDANTATR